jgi:phage tail sheath protein FI
MVDVAENLQDRFVILDCPRTRDIEVVKRWRRRTDSSYCAYYWPWVEMPSHDGSTREIPPSGVMAGVYGLRDTEVGVHQAPANTPLVGAVDLSLRVTEDHLGMLNAEGLNSFRISRGIRPWGARTASSDPDWRYINVRRLFIMMRRSLDRGMSWVPFEPNDAKTWSSVQDMVRTFCRRLFQLGMLAGGNPEEAFYVKCDAETNPSDEVAKGLLTCQIGVAPVIPAEFIMIQVTQTMNTGE